MGKHGCLGAGLGFAGLGKAQPSPAWAELGRLARPGQPIPSQARPGPAAPGLAEPGRARLDPTVPTGEGERGAMQSTFSILKNY